MAQIDSHTRFFELFVVTDDSLVTNTLLHFSTSLKSIFSSVAEKLGFLYKRGISFFFVDVTIARSHICIDMNNYRRALNLRTDAVHAIKYPLNTIWS